ncbi:UNVERIFIED_CONTAM: hypothetical protein FKN15_032742 [Acipenser sinensis]
MSLKRCLFLLSRAPNRASCLRSTVAVLGKGSAGASAVQRHCTGETGASGFISCRNASSSSTAKPPDTSLFVPLHVKATDNGEGSIGAELTQPLDKSDVLKVLNRFYKRKEMQRLAADNGLDGHVDDLYPYFMRHAKQIFPMLDCMEDLRKISDLRVPANWYPEARAIQRKIIFHAGPTNSGKTHHAIQRYLTAKSGVYCGPLKLLAHEIFEKSNNANVPCDLVTGEERTFVNPEGKQSSHVACTIEMCSVTTPYEVAVIDEIQMIRDLSRGWAWTRALLGLCAEEIHVCGEAAAIDFVTELMYSTGEEVEIRNYKRLTSMTMLDHAVESLDNLHPGDCVVCFNKNDIYSISRQIEARGLECAVIYGSLPPDEVAVIDEIQMIRDLSRGWAWTRALLGLCAEEIHVCGEAAAIDFVTELMYSTGEEVEIRNYKRLTSMTVLDNAVESLDNLHPGDCVVCFNKNDIYSISRQIEARGLECAVIYGSLPPGTKLAQAKKFNDPDDPCKILVATDAIGMGLNLSIKRIIFNSLVKPTVNEKGEKEMDTITTSQALQIAGRAGRFSSMFKEGEVTTMHRDDLPVLKEILSRTVDTIETAGLHPTAEQIEMFAYHLPDATLSNLITAGLHPTAEQIEMFAYHLPDATLSNLIDIFVSLSQVDGLYFVCNIDDFKFLADMIQHIPLNLRSRYVFCTAPINRKQPFVCTSFLKFARQFSRDEPLTFDWVCRHVRWPLVAPRNIKDLVHLEAVHLTLDLYLWLSYRFMDMFPDANLIRDIQKELDNIIQEGVRNITRLIRASETNTSSGTGTDAIPDDDIPLHRTFLKDRGLNAEDLPEARQQKQGQRRIRGSKMLGYRTLDTRQDGSLSSRLVQEGLLSTDLLEQLQREWAASQANGEDPWKETAGSGRKINLKGKKKNK